MSRSVKKHPIWKYGSWRWEKQTMNRYNRKIARQAMRNGLEPSPKEKKICSWDFDYCKSYLSKEYLRKWPYLIRK